MAIELSYPTNAELLEIDPEVMAATLDGDPLIGPGGLFPVEDSDSDKVVWEQRDNYRGRAQWRGLNSESKRVPAVGSARYEMEPGYYGEHMQIDEREILRRAAPATWAMPIPVDDLVMERERQLVHRGTVLMKYVISQLVTAGRYVIFDQDGSIGHADAFDIQVYSATARPLYDFRQIPILARGRGSMFGAGATALMNWQTWTYLISNTNSNDLRGERLDAQRSAQSLADVNTILTRSGLPTIAIYEDGYYDDNGVWTLYIPDNVVVLVGQRPNRQSVGTWRRTRNLAAPGGRGVSVETIRLGFQGTNSMAPPRIYVERLFNGGPTVWYPGSFFVMYV
jgi:hypothetical protein